jgi:hypothetical protein
MLSEPETANIEYRTPNVEPAYRQAGVEVKKTGISNP